MICRSTSTVLSLSCEGGGGQQLTYDALRRLLTWQNAPGSSPTASEQYAYDGEGNRVWQQAQSVNGSTTTTTDTAYILGVDELTTTSATGQQAVTANLRSYPLPGGAVAQRDATGLYYLATDQLGTPIAALRLTDGTLTGTQLRTPYGQARYAAASTSNGGMHTTAGFTGQHEDSQAPGSSGLTYFNARYYDPLVGRFTSADTLLAGGLDRYAYVKGRVESATDPSGHVYIPYDGGREGEAPGALADSVAGDAGDGIPSTTINYSADGSSEDVYVSDGGANTMTTTEYTTDGSNPSGSGNGNGNVTSETIYNADGTEETLTQADIAQEGEPAAEANAVHADANHARLADAQANANGDGTPATTDSTSTSTDNGTNGNGNGNGDNGSGGGSGESGGNSGSPANTQATVTEDGLNQVTTHLSNPLFTDEGGNMPPENIRMLQRLQNGLLQGGNVSGADANFYLHELYESDLMQQSGYSEESYQVAHQAALDAYGVSPFSLYAPEVIQALPGSFNSAWFRFWGL